MIHPDTELRFINPEIGYGVVATKLIPRGSITWVMDKLDRRFSQKFMSRLDPAYSELLKKYCFRDNKGRFILCWDLGRYVNHSFSPSCLTTAYDFELAIRDIHPGEQLTNHYGYLNLDPLLLMNDEGTEIKPVHPEDLFVLSEEWDEQLRQAFSFLHHVDQPLERFLSRKVKKQIQGVQSGRRTLDSIKSCYFPR